MDIFKQKRYFGLIVILLVLLNLISLTMLWIGRPERGELPNRPQNPVAEKQRIQKLLKEELDFDKEQTRQYLLLRKNHLDKMRSMSKEIREIKRQMFDEVLQDNPQPALSDSLLTLAQDKQARIEQLTFKYFLELKKLCGPEQQKKLRLLMHDLFRSRPPRMNYEL